jgi:hypothetical protein
MKKTYEKPVSLRQGVLSHLAAAVGSPPAPSDSRLKINISFVDKTVFGLPLYRFSYLGSDDMFTVVKAQDVLGVKPQAVSRDATGIYRVKYLMLGIEMKRAA